jgi:hypothetical protein
MKLRYRYLWGARVWVKLYHTDEYRVFPVLVFV